MAKLEIKNLTYIYSEGTPAAKKALNNINLRIKQNEFIGLIGRTGSGKSTLAKHLNALLKPTEGKILLDGEDFWHKPKKIRNVRFKVGMVFQYPEHQLFEETVYKDIAFGPSNMGLLEDEIEKKIHMACEFINLDFNLLYKSPFELSGGEKRKVAIAGVIAMDPEILILDEPTAGLDPKSREQLLCQLHYYYKSREKTVILISHNMDDIAKYSDRIIVLDDGNLIMFDSPKRVFSQIDLLKSVGLEPPQITSVMRSLLEVVPGLSDEILTVDEAVEALLNFVKNR